MPKLKLHLLGGFRLSGPKSKPITLKGKKSQALLAYLALYPGIHQRDKLGTLLWGDRMDEQARHSLRQALSSVRKALGDSKGHHLVADQETVALPEGTLWVDALEFRKLIDRDGPDLQSAIDLYAGPLLDTLRVNAEEFDRWAADERERLHSMACGVVEALMDEQEGAGDGEGAMVKARRLLELDATRESAHRLLMRLMAESGRRAEALKQYQACAEALHRELDAGPSSETVRLFEDIRGESDAPIANLTPLQTQEPPPFVSQRSLPLPLKPTLAVLPFTDISAGQDQSYLADGIAQDVITALSKNRWLLVLAWNSTVAFRNHDAPLPQLAREIDADYLVTASVRRDGEQIRINVQVIDGSSGTHIWAEKYDRALGGIFELQDEITSTITARIGPELELAEQQRSKHKPPQNLGAWDNYLLGLAQFYAFNNEANDMAQGLFEKAIELDPEFAPPYSWLSYSIVLSFVYFDAEPEQHLLDRALVLAQQGATIDGQDAVTRLLLGRIHVARGEHAQALHELEASVELNPCLAITYCGLGDALAYTGRLDEAMIHFEQAIRLSPHDPFRWAFYSYRSMAHLFRGEHEEAADWAERATRIPNVQYWANANLAAALGHLERHEEAHAAVETLLKRRPNFSCEFARHHLRYIKKAEQLEMYIEGLKKAGIPVAATHE